MSAPTARNLWRRAGAAAPGQPAVWRSVPRRVCGPFGAAAAPDRGGHEKRDPLRGASPSHRCPALGARPRLDQPSVGEHLDHHVADPGVALPADVRPRQQVQILSTVTLQSARPSATASRSSRTAPPAAAAVPSLRRGGLAAVQAAARRVPAGVANQSTARGLHIRQAAEGAATPERVANTGIVRAKRDLSRSFLCLCRRP